MAEVGEVGAENQMSEKRVSQRVVLEAPNIGQQRAQAVVEMKKLAESLKEPKVLAFLNEGEGNPYNSRTYGVIVLAKDPEAKASLVRIIVNQCLKEEDRSGAIARLLDAHASQLPLPEFSREFIVDQYEKALAEGKFEDARLIASMMLHMRGRIIKIPASEEMPGKIAWEKREAENLFWGEREQTAFEQHAESVLAKPIQPDDEKGARELSNLFDQLRHRQLSGFGSEIGKPIVEAHIALLEAQGNLELAAAHASLAGMPEETERLHKLGEQLAKKNNPGLLARVGKLLVGAKGK